MEGEPSQLHGGVTHTCADYVKGGTSASAQGSAPTFWLPLENGKLLGKEIDGNGITIAVAIKDYAGPGTYVEDKLDGDWPALWDLDGQASLRPCGQLRCCGHREGRRIRRVHVREPQSLRCRRGRVQGLRQGDLDLSGHLRRAPGSAPATPASYRWPTVEGAGEESLVATFAAPPVTDQSRGSVLDDGIDGRQEGVIVHAHLTTGYHAYLEGVRTRRRLHLVGPLVHESP